MEKFTIGEVYQRGADPTTRIMVLSIESWEKGYTLATLDVDEEYRTSNPSVKVIPFEEQSEWELWEV